MLGNSELIAFKSDQFRVSLKNQSVESP